MNSYYKKNSANDDEIRLSGDKYTDLSNAVNAAYDGLMNSEQYKPSISKSKYSTLSAQSDLKRHGYTDFQGKALKEDGVWGDKTNQAMAKALFHEQQIARPNDNTKHLQKLLNEYNYTDSNGDALKEDGVLGPRTDSAAYKAIDDLSSKNKSHTELPEWLDWDRDGRADTAEDKKRFDENKNKVADWNEWYTEKDLEYNGNRKELIKRKRELSCREIKVLDVPFIRQGSDDHLCWAATVAMISGYAGHELTPHEVGANAHGEADYNKGVYTTSEIENQFNNFGYLNGTSYKVGTRGKDGATLSFNDIKKDIDKGNPIIAGVKGESKSHAVVIVGYGVAANEGSSLVYINDPNSPEKNKIKTYDEFMKDWNKGYLRFEKER